MSQKKPSLNKSNDTELLALLNQVETDNTTSVSKTMRIFNDILDSNSEVQAFFTDFKIKPGLKPLDIRVMYALIDTYSGDNRQLRMSIIRIIKTKFKIRYDKIYLSKVCILFNNLFSLPAGKDLKALAKIKNYKYYPILNQYFDEIFNNKWITAGKDKANIEFMTFLLHAMYRMLNPDKPERKLKDCRLYLSDHIRNDRRRHKVLYNKNQNKFLIDLTNIPTDILQEVEEKCQKNRK